MDLDIEYLKRVAKESNAQISESAAFLGFCIDAWVDDPCCLIQLSLAILLDKSLFLLIAKGTKVPKNLIHIMEGYEFFQVGDEVSLKKAVSKLMCKATKFIEQG